MQKFWVIIRAIFWNSCQQRLRAFWRLSLETFLFIVISLVIATGIVFTSIGGIAFVQSWTSGVLISVAATFASMWLVGRFIDRRRFSDFGFHINKAWLLDMGFGLVLGALLMTGIFLTEWLLGWITIESFFLKPEGSPPFALTFFFPIALFIGVGVYEETLTRGYILRNIAEGLNIDVLGSKWALIIAWVISSLLFGLGHLGNTNATLISTAHIALAGIFLGLGYLLTGELAISIGIHITWNLFQGNVFGFPVSGIDVSKITCIAIQQGGPDVWTGGIFGPEAGLISICAIIVGCVLIVIWVHFRYGKATIRTSLAEYQRV